MSHVGSWHGRTWRTFLTMKWSYNQYLNCKILHGGTLLQPRLNFRENYVIPSQQLNDDQKKRSSPKIEVFFPQNQVNTKKKKKKRKKVFTTIWDYLLPEFVGFIRAGWLLIVPSSSAKISMGGPLNPDGGTPNLDGGTLTLDGGTPPPYNLSTACNCILSRDNGMTGMAVAQQKYHAVSSLNCDVVSIF